MNSTTDDFGENPFRSTAGGNGDLFFDSPNPNSFGGSFGGNQQQPPLQHQQQQHQQQQQQPMSFQQQPMPPTSDPFAPQPTLSTFPPPSGPMQPMSAQSPHQQGQTQPAASRSVWANLMTCLTLESYKEYFDIDAEDIATRVKAVMLDFYKPEHFRNNVLGVQKTDTFKGPDLYGPFWITMTLIFFIGVSTFSERSTLLHPPTLC